MTAMTPAPLAAAAAAVSEAGTTQTVKSPVCYVVDYEPGTQHIITSVLGGKNVRSEHFNSFAAMLQQCDIARPDLIIIDVTVSNQEARGYLEMLVSANVD